MRFLSRGFPMLLFIPIFLFTISGCSELDNLLKNPEAKIESIEIINIDFTSLTLQVNVEISNPNPVGITLDAYDYGLSIQGNEWLSGRQEKPVSLKAGGKSIIPIPVEITYQELLSTIESFPGSESVPVGIRMGLEIAFPYMGGIRLEVSGKGDIPILKIPLIQPNSINVDRVTLSGAEITLSFNIVNPNSSALIVNTAEGQVIVSDNEWGSISTNGAVKVPPRSSRNINLKMNIDFAEVGRSAWNLLTGNGHADIRIEGDMDISMDMPGFSSGGIPWNSDAKVSILR